MKLSLNNHGVCHEFASNEPELGVYSGSMSLGKIYTGNNKDNVIGIYSYNTFIGTRNLSTNTYLLSGRTYSNTTSNHQSILRQAVYNYITVYDVNDSKEDNLKHFISDLIHYSEKQTKARKTDYTDVINNTLDNMDKFLNYISIDKRSLLYKECISILNNRDNIIPFMLNLDQEAANKEAKLAKSKLAKTKRENKHFINSLNKENINTLLANRKNAYIDNDLKLFRELNSEYKTLSNKISQMKLKEFDFVLWSKDILKVTDNCNIITSQSVTISNNDAKILYLSIINKKIKVNDSVLNWTCYDINDNFIVIGCHTIAISDIKEIYQTLISCKEA